MNSIWPTYQKHGDIVLQSLIIAMTPEKPILEWEDFYEDSILEGAPYQVWSNTPERFGNWNVLERGTIVRNEMHSREYAKAVAEKLYKENQ